MLRRCATCPAQTPLSSNCSAVCSAIDLTDLGWGRARGQEAQEGGRQPCFLANETEHACMQHTVFCRGDAGQCPSCSATLTGQRCQRSAALPLSHSAALCALWMRSWCTAACSAAAQRCMRSAASRSQLRPAASGLSPPICAAGTAGTPAQRVVTCRRLQRCSSSSSSIHAATHAPPAPWPAPGRGGARAPPATPRGCLGQPAGPCRPPQPRPRAPQSPPAPWQSCRPRCRQVRQGCAQVGGLAVMHRRAQHSGGLPTLAKQLSTCALAALTP